MKWLTCLYCVIRSRGKHSVPWLLLCFIFFSCRNLNHFIDGLPTQSYLKCTQTYFTPIRLAFAPSLFLATDFFWDPHYKTLNKRTLHLWLWVMNQLLESLMSIFPIAAKSLPWKPCITMTSFWRNLMPQSQQWSPDAWKTKHKGDYHSSSLFILTALVFPRDQTGQSRDPNIDFIRWVCYQIQSLEVFAIYHREGTFIWIVARDVLVAQDFCIFPHPDLLDLIHRYCKWWNR